MRLDITKERKKVLIGAYGTLRNGEGNWGYFLKDKSNYLGTYQTEPNYTMYGKFSGFPIVTKGDASIEYDLFEIEDNNVLQAVHRLEGFNGNINDPANWYDVSSIETPHGDAYIYIQNNFKGSSESIIKNGNWLKRNAE